MELQGEARDTELIKPSHKASSVSSARPLACVVPLWELGGVQGGAGRGGVLPTHTGRATRPTLTRPGRGANPSGLTPREFVSESIVVVSGHDTTPEHHISRVGRHRGTRLLARARASGTPRRTWPRTITNHHVVPIPGQRRSELPETSGKLDNRANVS